MRFNLPTVYVLETMAESTPPAIRDSEDRQFTASDLREVAGLSYRQLNDWDAKGVLPRSREKDGAWRRFTPRDVFVIMVVAEIRKRFGVPLEMLSWLKSFMLQEGADHFQAAVELIAHLGVSVFVVTDLRKTFFMEPDVEVANLLMMEYYRGNEPDQFLAIKVNPIVNRILACLKNPVYLETHGLGYELYNRPPAGTKKGKKRRPRKSTKKGKRK